MRFYLIVAALLGFAIYGAMRANNPNNTALPFGTTDLSTVQEPLSKLSVNDRALVEGYVRRTNGDYLPAHMGDPDDPVDARTFGEAIKRQKEFLSKNAQYAANAEAFNAKRDASYEPLRKVIELRLVGSEVMPHDQAFGLSKYTFYIDGKYVQKYANEEPIFVTTYELENKSDDTIVRINGSIDIQRADPIPTQLNSLGGCGIQFSGRLLGGDRTKISCAKPNGGVTAENREWMSMRKDEYHMTWHPHEIEFADGKKLTQRD